MGLFLALLLGLSGTSQAVAPGQGRTSIAGRVVADGGTVPVRRATVLARRVNSDETIAQLTDDDGKFQFPDVADGPYTVHASKQGYIPMYYGAKRPNARGMTITVTAGQSELLQISLPRASVISGKVLTTTGTPVRAVSVALKLVLDGEVGRTIQPVRGLDGSGGISMTRTNEDGEYRLFGLPSGQYVVHAASGPQPRTAVDFFYPSALDLNAADIVALRAGEERADVDITIREAGSFQVAGTVEVPPLEFKQGRLVIVPGGSFETSVAVGPDGKFVLRGIPTGQYTAQVRGLARSGTEPWKSVWGEAPVVVQQDTSSVSVPLNFSGSVSGRVAFSGEATKASADVNLEPTYPWNGTAWRRTVTAGADGSFRIDGVAPGRYRITAAIQGTTPWRIVSSMTRSVDALDYPIEIRHGETLPDVTITFAPRSQSLSGSVLDVKGGPAAMSVIVFPVDPGLRNSARRKRTVQTGVDGRFAIQDLPSGDYFLSVVDDALPEDLTNLTLLDSLTASSMRVELGPAERKTVSLQMTIPR